MTAGHYEWANLRTEGGAVTDEEAFKLLAVEALAGFGWTITVEDMVDVQTVETVFLRIATWWNGLSADTRDIIRELDLADGLWYKGWLNEWPGFYSLLQGNPFGRFSATLDDVKLSMSNAKDRAPDYAAQHAIGHLADDPDFQSDPGT